jgi:DNA replication protein DnaC
MVQSAIRKNLTSKYYEWSDLISVITDFDKKDEVEQINEEFKNLDFVVIDGIEQYSYTHPLFIQNLDRLVKSRLNSGKPIFLMILGSTSNISTGSGWNSLIQNCLTIRLPHIR